MMTTPSHRLAVPALALCAALALTGCGGGSADTASTGGPSSSGHGAGHSTDTAGASETDIAFLTGMRPHHEQAVEMSDIVLAADPPAEVAALARRIKGAQAPEIEQMDRMLDELGHEDDGGHGGGHGGHAAAHGGMMTEQEMAALRAATGTEAARLYLEAMIEHHEGAIDASEAQLADGRHAPALAMAEQIRRVQAAEIAEMRALLARL